MGINWGSAIAKGVSVAGAHYQAERDKKAAEKRAFEQKTELLGIQHANAIALHDKEYEGRFKVARAKKEAKDALRILSEEQLAEIREKTIKGGVNK